MPDKWSNNRVQAATEEDGLSHSGMFFGENPSGPAFHPLPPNFGIALPELFSAHFE
jgi:hypothetical protein